MENSNEKITGAERNKQMGEAIKARMEQMKSEYPDITEGQLRIIATREILQESK